MAAVRAQQTSGRIIAVDNYQPFLDTITTEAQRLGVADRIQVLCADMSALVFPDATIDLIWSEGAIYIMGFEKALPHFRPMLKPHGCFVISEIVYFSDDVPDELRQFWNVECPFMTTVAQNIRMIETSGYRLLNHFPLPESVWWDSYYTPLSQRVALFERQPLTDDQRAQLQATKFEIDIFRRYGKLYGYEFFVMQRR